MVDSGTAALVGAIVGGILAWRLSDGDTRAALVGAAAGLVAAGEGSEQALGI